jgi:predicted nucleic acid-binding protein
VKAAYWDTSCVLALYAPEEISSQAAKLASIEKGPLHSSAILEFEMTFAVQAKEARGEIPRGSSGRVLSQFQTDLQQGRFLLVPLGIDIKACTKDIAARTLQAEPPVFLRTLDGIHIATALELGALELITADKKIADAATLLGIYTIFLNKLSPSNF